MTNENRAHQTEWRAKRLYSKENVDSRSHGPRDLPRFDSPLRIGAIADTHAYACGRRHLPAEVLDLFRRFNVGLICHAGDINDASVLEQIAALAPVLAVRGNNDVPELQSRLPRLQEFMVGTFRFGLLHGDGGTSARHMAKTTFPPPIDLVIYGHSHIPKIESLDGAIYFNPGSPTDRRFSPHFGIGLITVSEDRIEPELILFENAEHLVNVQPSSRRSSSHPELKRSGGAVARKEKG